MPTINQFFDLQNGTADWVSRMVDSREFAPVRQRMVQEMKGYPAPPSFDALVVRQLTDLLDIELSHVLIGAWRKRQEIIQYRDREQYPPGEVHVVPLLEHTVTSRHSPTIQPIINNVPLPKIKFDVVLRLKMKGIMLKILDAKIKEILTGECLGNGSIQFEGVTLVERQTAPVSLPGSIVLKEAMVI